MSDLERYEKAQVTTSQTTYEIDSSHEAELELEIVQESENFKKDD